MNRVLRICLIAVLGFSVVPETQAQTIAYAGVGLNQSYSALDSLNWVIGRFNENNTWQNEPLGEFHLPNGFAISAGAAFGRLLIDIGYTGRSQGRRSEGSVAQGAQPQERRIIYSSNTIDVGVGVKIAGGDRGMVAIGTSLDFGNTRVRTKSGTSDQVASQPWARVMNELNLGSRIFAQVLIPFGSDVGPGLLIRPYYQFAWVQNDFQPVNQFINPTTYLQDPQFILGRVSNVGLTVALVIVGGS